MHTERLNIRRLREEDLDDLYALLSDGEVMKHLEAPYTKEAACAFLHRCGIAENPLIYAVEDHCKTFAGYIIYHSYDAVSYEIGWVLHKGYWGKGYANELTKWLIEDARHKTENLIIGCSPAQIATKRIAFKHRFSFVENRDGLETYALCLHDKF